MLYESIPKPKYVYSYDQVKKRFKMKDLHYKKELTFSRRELAEAIRCLTDLLNGCGEEEDAE